VSPKESPQTMCKREGMQYTQDANHVHAQTTHCVQFPELDANFVGPRRFIIVTVSKDMEGGAPSDQDRRRGWPPKARQPFAA